MIEGRYGCFLLGQRQKPALIGFPPDFPDWLRGGEGRWDGRMGRMPLPPFSVHSFVLITRPLTPLARAFEKRAAGPKVAILCDQYCCTFFMATFVLRTYFQ